MANNRSSISHPALNTTGGTSLWNSIDAIYQLFSDNDIGRWVSFSALANSATTTITHGFGVSVDDLKVVVYTGTYPNMTQATTFTVVANGTNPKTQIDVTAPASGGPFTGSVLIVHDASAQLRLLSTAQRTALTPVVKGYTVYDTTLNQVFSWNGSAWVALLDASSTQVVTNKDIDGGTASNTSRITLPRAAKSTLDGLARKAGTVLYGTDTQKAYIDTGSTLTAIGSGGSSGRNYLTLTADGNNPIGTIQDTLTDTGNRSSAGQNWGASDTTKLTVVNNVTTPLRETGDFKLSHVAVGAAFIESVQFIVDRADAGKALVVSFDMTGNALSGDYDVVAVRYNSSGVYQEKISIAGTASTGTPASALLPTGTTIFKGFFITSTSTTDLYAIRLRRLSGTATSSVQIDTLFVGPQSLGTGAVVTAPASFTPTGSWVANTTYTGSYIRVGNYAEFEINVALSGAPTSANLTINMPSGLTIDVPSGWVSNDTVLGWGSVTDSGVANYYVSPAYQSSTAIIVKNIGTSVTYANVPTYVNQAAPMTFGSGDSIQIYFRVPISQWTSNVTMADRAVEEYASNSNATTSLNTSDTTSFAYGISGSLIPNQSATTAATVRRVRFTSPILPTDSLILEMLNPGGANVWVPMTQFYPPMRQGSSVYGTFVITVNSTDCDVYFNAQGRSPTGATYGAVDSSNWASEFSAGSKWRIRKVSGGAAVGFPIAPANITLVNTSDNYSGNTKLGLMAYSHGGSYNGGLAPTITLTSGGGTLSSVISSSFIPYQVADGSWRLKFNAFMTVSSASRSQAQFSVVGVTTKSIVSFYQAISANDTNITMLGYTSYGSSAMMIAQHAAATTTVYTFSGDIALESKPSWAY